MISYYIVLVTHISIYYIIYYIILYHIIFNHELLYSIIIFNHIISNMNGTVRLMHFGLLNVKALLKLNVLSEESL